MSNTTTAMLNRDAVCAVPPRAGTVCDICRGERMTPQRYAELFGEAG
jgi:hypothetical protein